MTLLPNNFERSVQTLQLAQVTALFATVIPINKNVVNNELKRINICIENRNAMGDMKRTWNILQDLIGTRKKGNNTNLIYCIKTISKIAILTSYYHLNILYLFSIP